MEDYNFWADLLDTVRSTADWVKALWIVMWSVFWLGVVALVLHYWLALARFTARRRDVLRMMRVIRWRASAGCSRAGGESDRTACHQPTPVILVLDTRIHTGSKGCLDPRVGA